MRTAILAMTELGPMPDAIEALATVDVGASTRRCKWLDNSQLFARIWAQFEANAGD